MYINYYINENIKYEHSENIECENDKNIDCENDKNIECENNNISITNFNKLLNFNNLLKFNDVYVHIINKWIYNISFTINDILLVVNLSPLLLLLVEINIGSELVYLPLRAKYSAIGW